MTSLILLNARANDATIVFSFAMRAKNQNLGDRLKQQIASHAPPQMLSIA